MPKLTAEDLKAAAAIGEDITKPPYTNEYNAQELATLRALLQTKVKAFKDKTDVASMAGFTNTNESTTYKEALKLTPASAKALLATAVKDAQYTGAFTDADVKDFISKFQASANAQMQIVIKDAQSRMTPGQTPTDLAKTVSSLMTTTYSSFFKPTDFAKDYVWSKVNFGNDKTLAGNNLATLSQVRQLVKDFNLLGVSDAEIAIAAKSIAKGNKTLADYTAELQRIAIQEHPALAERLKTDPSLTIKSIAQPVITLLASTWEVDPATIGLDDPIVSQYLRPGGADGKGATLNYADVKRLALASPKYEMTTKANEDARDAAVGLARAMGAGF
jgi:hypothetical protein